MNININLLDSRSIDKALKQLEDLKLKIRDFSADFAEESRMKVGYPNVSVIHHGQGKHTIVASDDQIAFMEWGAGFTADTNSGFGDLGGDSFFTYPGVWSKDHERTFQRWVASNKDPSAYRYNRQPLRGMETTARNMRSDVFRFAQERFK